MSLSVPKDLAVSMDPQGEVAILSINRPEAANSINPTVVDLLLKFSSALGNDPSIRGIIITGKGERHFCSGGDLKAFATIQDRAGLEATFQPVRALLDHFAKLPVPVVAAINGQALGGGVELAIACDFRVASARAKFCLPQARLGIIPGWNAIDRLIAVCGRSRAMHLILTCSPISAADAEKNGLVDLLTPDDPVECARQLILSFSRATPQAVAGCKQAFAIVDASNATQCRGAINEIFADLWFSREHMEAQSKFINRKQKPSGGKQ